MIKIEDYKTFKRNITSLKETSKDNHDGSTCFMTKSSLKVINFDRVKDEYIKDLNLSANPKSNDALYIASNGNPTFIEFKNGSMDNKDIFDVRGKVFDSILIFTDIVNRGISYTKENMDYILVYNQEKNSDEEETSKKVQASKSRDQIGKRIMELGGDNHIRFGLERFKKYCFRNVFTYTEDEFEQKFVTIQSAK